MGVLGGIGKWGYVSFVILNEVKDSTSDRLRVNDDAERLRGEHNVEDVSLICVVVKALRKLRVTRGDCIANEKSALRKLRVTREIV